MGRMAREGDTMNAETDAFYGRDKPSKTYKWGLALPRMEDVRTGAVCDWRIVAWFPSRKNAEGYAKRVHGRQPHAIARANLAEL
jgi:hypothetical protein